MNQSEIYSLARSVGLSDKQAKTAAAIAMAESGGNPSAHAKDSDDDSYGLWQINMIGALGPERRKRFSLARNEDLLNPRTNASVMKTLSAGGTNWKPWTTYTSGKYLEYAGNPVTRVDDASLGSIIGGFASGLADGASDAAEDAANPISLPVDVVDAFAKISDGLNRTTRWVSNQRNWLRIAYVVGGGALVLTAIGIVAKPYAGRVASLAPVGKITKLVKGK